MQDFAVNPSSDKVQLRSRILAYREENPKARLVDVAQALAVSEMEAIACQVDNENITTLQADWQKLFAAIPGMGRVMALTRNQFVVHECKGQYAAASWQGIMGLVHGEIDLRMFSNRWKTLFAVKVAHPRGLLRSFQIFDEYGKAVHKIFLEPTGDVAAYEVLVREMKIEQAPLPEVVANKVVPETFRSIQPAEIEEFRLDWAKIQDTHEFFNLLRKHKVPRLQAMEIAGPEYAREVGKEALSQILELARDTEEPLMAFVGNPGMIQIYSGKISNIKKIGDWLNVLDPDFNLHIDEKGIHRSFVVHKPTRNGVISSLEIYSAQDELILSLFGYRMNDKQPSPSWGRLLSSLIGCL